MLDPIGLEKKIGELLDNFYERRLEKINTLKLTNTLKRKNPYLYRATGVQKAHEIVEELLKAYMSSSDEGIFGDAFFEPLAKYASQGIVAPAEGVDVAVETETKYMAIAVKSGPAVFNAQSKRRQADEFKALQKRLQKLQKQFDPVVGYSYGNKQQGKNSSASFRELAGQAFWHEITGDADFYLKIIRLMKEKPQEHRPKYEEAFAKAANRFTLEFSLMFCQEDGSIDWDNLTKFNSGIPEKKHNKST